MAESLTPERGTSSRVVFPCDLTEARAATRMLRAFLSEQGLDESETFNCELCLAEACNNAVQHREAGAASQPIVAEVVCRPSSVEIAVTDHTTGFDLTADSPLISPDQESGRGLF